MKSIFKEIFPGLTVATAFVLTSVSALSLQSPVAAQPQKPSLTPQQTQNFFNDLFSSSSQDFFRQGREKLEREIEILTQRRLFLQEPVLNVDALPKGEDFSPTDEIKPLENPNLQ
jgi:hypothetical protein